LTAVLHWQIISLQDKETGEKGKNAKDYFTDNHYAGSIVDPS
jgi:hypothetical protein